jgi:hypothetical protein
MHGTTHTSHASQSPVLPTPDVTVSNHGSLFLVTPFTQDARDWINTNVHAEGWQWLGQSLAVEHRFVAHLVDGMLDAGLDVQ